MYDYLENITNDITDYLAENADDLRAYLAENDGDADALREKLNDDLWIADSVTGNASGSYWFNGYRAEEALVGNWTLAVEACKEFGTVSDMELGAEYVDVTIRCYLLSQAIDAALDDFLTGGCDAK